MATLRDELALANHILFAQGVVDAFGHISVRDPDRPGGFLLARSTAPSSVTADDIMALDADSEPAPGDERRPYLERFIHGEIYRVRPDVMSVVHSHSASVIPFGVVDGVRLRPVYHMAGFLGGAGAALFEIRDCAGEGSDMLIRDRRLGAALASVLGGADVVLMRGHGSTAVGNSIRQAVYRAIYTEVNARLQCQAAGMGRVNFLTDAEARAASAANEGQLNRAWDMWAQAAGGG